MSNPQKKMSGAKIAALTISIGLHAILAFYLGRMALDYALPKGEVSSIEVNIDTPVGDTTEVDVVKTAPEPISEPAPVAEPIKETPKAVEAKPAPPKQVAEKPAPKAEPIPKSLPAKEAVVEDHQGELPVAAAVEESTTPAVDPMPAPEETPAAEVAPVIEEPATPIETVQAVAPTEAPAAAAPTATATEQGYGTPVGNPSADLIPYGSNRRHTYPYMARLRKIEGTTSVQYIVAPSGNVSEVKILQSSGSSMLDDEAVDTIKKWKFKPMNSEVTYEKEVVFRFKGDATPAPSKLRRNN